MTTQLHQTQRGHLISEMVVSFILLSLCRSPDFGATANHGTPVLLAGPAGFAISATLRFVCF